MTRFLNSLIFICITSIFSSPLPAQGTSIQKALHCKASELGQHPIEIGDLSLTISHLNYRSLKLLLKNVSELFIPFSPDDLTILGSDGSQNYIEITYIRDPGRWISPAQVKIGPKAHLQLEYGLNDEVKFPAKIFYKGKPIVEITK